MFYGWRMVAGAFFSQSMHSALLFLSQGLYVVQFEQTFAWSRGAISWAFGLLRIETGLLGPIQGWMIDRFGPRPVMRIGTLLFGAGLILLGQIQELWHLFAALTIIAMGTSLAGFLTVNTALANWFVRRRARAMSVTSIGFASGAVLAPVVAWSITEFGWRETAVYSGIAAMLVGFPASQMFRPPSRRQVTIASCRRRSGTAHIAVKQIRLRYARTGSHTVSRSWGRCPRSARRRRAVDFPDVVRSSPALPAGVFQEAQAALGSAALTGAM